MIATEIDFLPIFLLSPRINTFRSIASITSIATHVTMCDSLVTIAIFSSFCR